MVGVYIAWTYIQALVSTIKFINNHFTSKGKRKNELKKSGGKSVENPRIDD